MHIPSENNGIYESVSTHVTRRFSQIYRERYRRVKLQATSFENKPRQKWWMRRVENNNFNDRYCILLLQLLERENVCVSIITGNPKV